MAYESPENQQPGAPFECLSIPIVLKKVPLQNSDGTTTLKCGFRIGGGIDQDYKKSPHGYKDNGVYVTYVQEDSPAAGAGLQTHDKILQVNGYDFTMVTHKKAVEYIQKFDILNMLVTRPGVPPLQ